MLDTNFNFVKAKLEALKRKKGKNPPSIIPPPPKAPIVGAGLDDADRFETMKDLVQLAEDDEKVVPTRVKDIIDFLDNKPRKVPWYRQTGRGIAQKRQLLVEMYDLLEPVVGDDSGYTRLKKSMDRYKEELGEKKEPLEEKKEPPAEPPAKPEDEPPAGPVDEPPRPPVEEKKLEDVPYYDIVKGDIPPPPLVGERVGFEPPENLDENKYVSIMSQDKALLNVRESLLKTQLERKGYDEMSYDLLPHSFIYEFEELYNNDSPLSAFKKLFAKLPSVRPQIETKQYKMDVFEKVAQAAAEEGKPIPAKRGRRKAAKSELEQVIMSKPAELRPIPKKAARKYKPRKAKK